eukprot:145254-Chlamydomonas_euryale.AAC.1
MCAATRLLPNTPPPVAPVLPPQLPARSSPPDTPPSSSPSSWEHPTVRMSRSAASLWGVCAGHEIRAAMRDGLY